MHQIKKYLTCQIMRITSCISDKNFLALINANLIIFEIYRNIMYYKKALFTAFCYDWNKIAEFAGFCSNHLYAHMVDWLWKKQKTIKSNHFWICIYTWSNLTKNFWKLSDFHHINGARNISLICSGMKIEMSLQMWFSPILEKKDKPNPRP